MKTARPAASATPKDSVNPTPTASAPAASGPITGMISTTPAKIPSRSQNGRPMAQNVIESTVATRTRSEEHTSELQSRQYLVCRLLLEKKTNIKYTTLVSQKVNQDI